MDSSLLQRVLACSLNVCVWVCVGGDEVACISDGVTQGAGVGGACISLSFFIAEVCISLRFGVGLRGLG